MHLRTGLILFLVVYSASSCNPTKYVPEGKTLLVKNHVKVNNDGVKENDLLQYVKQKPNKKIFGTRFHLGLYNLSNLEKNKWPHSWLRNIGEEPVIYDSVATGVSRDQIGSYVASKGYFDGQVTDSVITEKRKSEVFYDVNLKSPFTIRNLYYDIADTSIRSLFYFDSVNCMIERGEPYDVEILQDELTRFETVVKNSGYYSFSRDYISFLVDSTIGNRQVNITYTIRNSMQVDLYNRIIHVPHSKYKIRDVYIFPDFVPRDVLERGESYLESLDTVNYQGYFFVSGEKRPQVMYDLILQSIYLNPGAGYNITDVAQSEKHLMGLKVYRLVNIFFNEVQDTETDPEGKLSLDCNVQLTLLSHQSFNVELEGTNTAGSPGGALNLIYQNKNLLHGAELFNMKVRGAFEVVTQKNLRNKSSQELGVETSLRLPQFLLPFLKKEGFIRNYNPTTTIMAAYNYQNMPFYTRTMANATFGYTWEARKYQTHIVNPLQLNFVRLLSIDPDFESRIEKSSYLAYAYKDVMILGGSYSFIFNNQKIQKSDDYLFLRINAEASGNMLSVISRLAGLGKTEGSYNIFGQPFAQYFRTDLDIRYNVILNEASSAVYRGFIGLGIPYGNSRAIPFEKQYFGGGANGIRAWQVRSLGPGSYVPAETEFINQTADIKLEANAEYRFNLFWILEGAVFLDAGNIWTFNEDESRQGAMFRLKDFYKDIAVGTGAGFRFDFNFVIGRLDLGLKLRDPIIEHGSKWIIMSRPYDFRNDLVLVVGIGYPF